MKKFLALSLVMMLALSLLPGTAFARETLKVGKAEEFRFPTDGTVPTAFTIENTNDYDIDVTVEVFDQEERVVVATIQFNLPKDSGPYNVSAGIYQGLEKDGQFRLYEYRIVTSGGTKRFVHVAQKLTITEDKDGNLIYDYDQIRNAHYPNNTVSSFGPHFRDVTPELTDLWYMFTPIDLSIQGRQVFPLVASNIYEVGEVYVDVNQDTVVVSYYMFHNDRRYFSTEQLSEFLKFYNSYADVGIVEPEDMPEPKTIFAFNQPFSILNHLGGDTNVLMFVRNRISYYRYPTPRNEYVRFWENKPEYEVRRNQMLQFMDPIMTVVE